MPKVLTVFYSTYGHNFTMAKSAIAGIKKVHGAEASLFRIPETLSPEILGKMHAAEAAKQWADIPVITPDIIKTADAVIFSYPTRFGNMPAQVKTFFDSLGQLWMQDALVGKVASVMTSSGSPHGGQESTILTSVPVLMHLGFIYVGMPYTNKLQMKQELQGGSPYGASTIAGDGSKQPTADDKASAEFVGEYVAKIAAALKIGRAEYLKQSVAHFDAAQEQPAAQQ